MNEFFIVTEESLNEAIIKCTDEKERESYKQILIIGKQWEAVELTPVYLYSPFTQQVKVISREMIGQRLH